MTDLTGKTAFVTGSSRGIGASIARRLAQAGAWVALHGRDEAALAALSRELPSSIVVTGDLTDRAVAPRLAEKVLVTFVTHDILDANAGGRHAPPRPIEEITD
jgi:NADP-dependent 3-hydroxy acid dehydrogenase YdfG